MQVELDCRVLSPSIGSVRLLDIFNRCLHTINTTNDNNSSAGHNSTTVSSSSSTSSSFALSQSPNISHSVQVQLAVIDFLDSLLTLPQVEETILIRFANSLRQLLHSSSSDSLVLHGASVALGHLARLNSPLTVDLVNFQVKQAFEWIQHSISDEGANTKNVPATDSRLLAGVLVLKELAANAPTLFNVYVPLFLETIWIPLKSSRIEVREASTLALRVCLMDIGTRAERWKKQCWTNILDHTRIGLGKNNRPRPTENATDSINNGLSASSLPSSVCSPIIDVSSSSSTSSSSLSLVHGCLLALGELLEHANSDFLRPHFTELTQLILSHQADQSVILRRTILILIPRIAKLQIEEFKQHYLKETAIFIETHMNTELSDQPQTMPRRHMCASYSDSTLFLWLFFPLPQSRYCISFSWSTCLTDGIGVDAFCYKSFPSSPFKYLDDGWHRT